MSNKVDKLFKDKLEGDSLQPSAQAWEKVEAHLGKKNKMVLWLRVAAVVVLLSALTFVALRWNSNYEEPQQELVKQNDERTPKTTPVDEPKQPVASQKSEVRSRESGARSQDAGRRTQEAKPRTQNLEPRTQNAEPTEQLAVVPEQTVVSEPTLSTQKGITLTYSLPSVKKPEATPEPVVAETKKTGLERVLEIAKEVKNSDSPLGELREAKNDIFALDFKKDKDKNKKQNQGF